MALRQKITDSIANLKLKPFTSIVDKINDLEPNYAKLSDSDLSAKIATYRDRLSKGEKFDKILPDVFAIAREATKRVFGIRLRDNQLIASLVIKNNRSFAEMKTGEGKTVSFYPAALLNIIAGQKIHLMTSDDYLASRDANDMDKFLKFFNMSASATTRGMNASQKKQAYLSDVVYGTPAEFCFDYLHDNMVKNAEDVYCNTPLAKIHLFIDEADKNLQDDATTPFIIGGKRANSKEEFGFLKAGTLFAATLVNALKIDSIRNIAIGNNDRYIEIDNKDKSVLLNDEGYSKIKVYLKDLVMHIRGTLPIYNENSSLKNAYNIQPFFIKEIQRFRNSELKPYIDRIMSLKEDQIDAFVEDEIVNLHSFINNALRAEEFYNEGVDYIVSKGKIVLIDQNTGRLLPNTKLKNGMHQALEAKEMLGTPNITNEDITIASITLPNYVNLYGSISGMSGTLMSSESELYDQYRISVFEVPTYKPVIRKDEPDRLFNSISEKYRAIVEDVFNHHKNGQPILIGTSSVEESEELSHILSQMGLDCTVLNATIGTDKDNLQKQARIISQAGKLGKITVSTNMAGRGTDIKLGGDPEIIAKTKIQEKFSDIPELVTRALNTADNDPFVSALRNEYNEILEKETKLAEEEYEKVAKVGGLRVIGTMRQPSIRVDNQLRGRAGRQGDPGSSIFYGSSEDSILMQFPHKEGTDLEESLNKAQQYTESINVALRKQNAKFDAILDRTRKVIYADRKRILSGEDMHGQVKGFVYDLVSGIFDEYCDGYSTDFESLNNALSELARTNIKPITKKVLTSSRIKNLKEEYTNIIFDIIDKKLKGTKGDLRKIEQEIILNAMDKNWSDFLTTSENLLQTIFISSINSTNIYYDFYKQFDQNRKILYNQIKSEVVNSLLTLEEGKKASIKTSPRPNKNNDEWA